MDVTSVTEPCWQVGGSPAGRARLSCRMSVRLGTPVGLDWLEAAGSVYGVRAARGIGLPIRGAVCLSLVTQSLDPNGRRMARWVTRWKPACNAFAISFEGRYLPSSTFHLT